MKFFLRFTPTPDLDLERGTSYHETPWDEDERTIEEVAEACDCPVDSIEAFDFRGRGVNTYMQALGGLCGFELEAQTLEDAIKEAEDKYAASNDGHGYDMRSIPTWAIFTGSVEDRCPEGVVFCPRAVVHQADATAVHE